MAHLLISQAASVPSVAQLVAFLRTQGWTQTRTQGNWATYTLDVEGESIGIEVPLVETASDFPRVVRMLLGDLAQILERPAAALLRDILVQGKDLLRLRIEGPSTEDGKLSLEAGRGVYQGARDLILAVASSVLDAKGVFPTRKPSEAMAMVRQARLGLPEHGSVVLVIENPLPPSLAQQHLFEGEIPMGDLPMERRMSLRFAESMVALASAVQRTQVEDSLDPFIDAIPHGVSANLCEAVSQILDATDAERLTSTVAYSTRWPLPADARRDPGVIGRSMRPILREAAKAMREQELYAGMTIEGPVVKLHSDDTQQGGTAAVRAQALDTTRTIWVRLDATDYDRVLWAHKDGQLVRLTGELKREGSWWLRTPRDLQLVPLDEEPT